MNQITDWFNLGVAAFGTLAGGVAAYVAIRVDLVKALTLAQSAHEKANAAEEIAVRAHARIDAMHDIGGMR